MATSRYRHAFKMPAPAPVASARYRHRRRAPEILRGAVAWFDASREELFDGAAMTAERDFSGNGLHATAAGAGAPWKYKRPPVGLPSAYADGTVKYYSVSFGATIPQPLTIYAVVRLDDTAGAHEVFDGIDGTNRCTLYTTGGVWQAYAGTVGNSPVAPTATWHVVGVTFNGANSVIDIDGVETAVNLGTAGLAGLRLGASSSALYPWQGAFGELGAWRGAFNASQRALIRDYLRAKWSRYFQYPFNLTGLRGWWRAGNIGGNDGDLVSLWRDYSGFGNDLTAAGSARPTLTTNVRNGRAVLRYAGTQDMILNAFPAALAQPNTILFAARQSSVGSTQYLFDGVSGGRHLFSSLATNYGMSAGANQSVSLTPDTNWHRWATLWNGAASSAFRDGVSGAVSGDITAGTLAGLHVGNVIGSATGLVGDIAEVVVCNADVGAPGRAVFDAAMAGEYAL